MAQLCLFISVFLLSYTICHALECYVCDQQEDNNEKCTKSIKTCEQFEDVCMTEISWGSTPYWSQGALKQYYISKKCATKSQCIKTRERNMQYCTHIWYEDWSCSECCQGDRCNYYIISGSTPTKSSIVTLVTTLLVYLFYKY
ncbi:coiled [Arctopsyche grandis]|uniref:coiled n=1 Tax=Arctopsyche grandis TaxID=121162 RepID=UPI00406D86DD